MVESWRCSIWGRWNRLFVTLVAKSSRTLGSWNGSLHTPCLSRNAIVCWWFPRFLASCNAFLLLYSKEAHWLSVVRVVRGPLGRQEH
mmetsp:Transcript_49243/g.107402  ORF Transcript_49243/g.107402 Transcript_49243/m.107402 type:complete len:87 (+) Transcript_49243:1108-1368(+)